MDVTLSVNTWLRIAAHAEAKGEVGIWPGFVILVRARVGDLRARPSRRLRIFLDQDGVQMTVECLEEMARNN
jgi:hypothetical protein